MLIVSMATRQDDQVGAKQAEERGRYSYSQLVIICRVGLEGVRSSGVLLPGHVLLTQGGVRTALILSPSQKGQHLEEFLQSLVEMIKYPASQAKYDTSRHQTLG